MLSMVATGSGGPACCAALPLLGALAAAAATLAADVGHVVPILAHRLAAAPADVGHVVAVLADGLSTLAAGGAGLVGAEAVGDAARVGGRTAETGDLALLLGAH